MSHAQRYRELAALLGMSGAWLEVGQAALCDRKIPISPGYYFLVWGNRAILWEEGPQGPDSRIPPQVFWLYAWNTWGTEPAAWEGAFRAGQGFAHRESLLRLVGFHRNELSFAFMETVPHDTDWEW